MFRVGPSLKVGDLASIRHMNQQHVLGIDIGGTGIKGALVDLAVGDLVWGRVVAAEGVDLIVREEQPQ